MFTTRDEAVQNLIVHPIEATGVVDARAEYDVDAIADAVLVADPLRGFIYADNAARDDFWGTVEANER